MITERVFLAEIKSVIGESNLAWARPLVESSRDQMKWEGPVEDAAQKFPDKGLVFWFNPPHGIKEGEYWQIEVDEHPQYDGLRRSEKYQVLRFHEPIEVVDLRRWTENDLRRKLNSDGIRIEPTPLRPEVLFWIAEGHWVGPVDISQSGAGKWVLTSSDPTRLDCWIPGEDAYGELQLDKLRMVVSPGHDFGERCGYVNWASEVEFALGVLKRIRKLDKSAYDALDVTYAVFEKYQEVLASSGLSGLDLQHERARLERGNELRNLVESNEELLNTTVSSLLQSKVVQSELEEEKRDLRSEIETEIELEMMQKLKSERSKLRELESQISTQSSELEEVQTKITEEKKRLEEKISSFENALREKLNELARVELQDIFADSVALRAMLSIGSDDLAPAPPESSAPRTPWGGSVECERFEKVKEAASSFTKQLIANEVGSKTMAIDIFSAFMGSGAICISGSSINQVLDLFADTVTGGRLLWIPVPGGSIAPSDFLVSRNDGSVTPHPNGLLETLVEAESSDELYLVVLEGFDRAPVESYLHPLLASLTESLQSDRNRRRIPLPAKTAVADTFVSRVAWPTNVLMACTPTGGTTANLPVPRNFWDSVSLVHTDLYEPSEISDLFNADEGKHSTALRASTWLNWRRRMQEEIDFAPLDDAQAASDDVIFTTQFRLAKSSYGIARLLGESEDNALATAARLSILPRLAYEMAATPQSMLEAFQIDKEIAGTVSDLIRNRLS